MTVLSLLHSETETSEPPSEPTPTPTTDPTEEPTPTPTTDPTEEPTSPEPSPMPSESAPSPTHTDDFTVCGVHASTPCHVYVPEQVLMFSGLAVLLVVFLLAAILGAQLRRG